MFGAEPQEPWTKEERTEFKEHAAARINDAKSSALKAGIAFLCNVAIIAPFSVVQRLQAYWPRARFLVFSAELLFLWFVMKVGFIWSSWQSSREIRREYDRLGLAASEADYIHAHKHCIENRSEIEASTLCGCFYCMSIYPPSEIVDWIDDQEAMTVDCPRCGIDAVIGSASGFPITAELLNRMNAHWFEGHRSGEHP